MRSLLLPLVVPVAVYAAALDPDHARLVPEDKGIDRAALVERDAPTVWSGEQLHYIGMPVSGIGTGQLYLGGDGQLWSWQIFNEDDIWSKCEGHRYMYPSDPADFRPVEQGFAVAWKQGGKMTQRSLDADGFSDIRFHPKFPMATVEYRDASVPLDVDLTAYTPYIPLDVERSSFPVTLMEYTVTNTGSKAVETALSGWIENTSHDMVRGMLPGTRLNQPMTGENFEGVVTSATVDSTELPEMESVVFEDFNGDDFGDWTATGDAFGDGPEVFKSANRRVMIEGNQDGKVAVSIRTDDKQMGTLTSAPFTVEKPFITMTFAAGRMPQGGGLRLLVDGEVVRWITGIKPRKFEQRSWNVGDLIGREAQIQLFDESAAEQGYVAVDTIEFTTRPVEKDMPEDVTKTGDTGQFALAVVRPEGRVSLALDKNGDAAITNSDEASFPLEARPLAQVSNVLKLKPGESKTVTFLLSWRYPHRIPKVDRMFAKRWPDIQAQVAAVADDLPALREETKLFVDTWRDSTLPHWLLDRILIPNAALNSNTVHESEARIRYTFLEGSTSLGGNCTHVWHYGQGPARLFPFIERTNREFVELGVGYTKDNQIKYRAGPSKKYMTAMDGTTGTILRILREHQMTTDDTFLTRVWPKTKKAMIYLIDRFDANEDGITEGWQHNTLDQDWAGDVPWLCSMYQAALSACVEMAGVVGDEAFAARCEAIVEKGRVEFDARMWDADRGYYIMVADPKIKKPSPGTYEGVHIDQVLGEWWLSQVGLDPILPEEKTKSALQSIFRYNYLPDIGPYREVFRGGRWYAAPGEPGLLMASFPFGGGARLHDARGGHAYLNECMTGFEWQAAAHMIHVGLVEEGLQVVKALDERYAPENRNPFNEVECGDHYGRATASYAVLIALSGYRYDGPDGLLGFAPKLTPEDFRAPFTTAEGWGTFAQKRTSKNQTNEIHIVHGETTLNQLEFDVPQGWNSVGAKVYLGKRVVDAVQSLEGNRVSLKLSEPLTLAPDQILTVSIKKK